MNFNELPNDIKLSIFNINKNIDKHNKLLKSTINELNNLFEISIEYSMYIKECVGFSVWEHKADFDYWVELEKDNYLKNYSIKYFKNKSLLIKFIIDSKFGNSNV